MKQPVIVLETDGWALVNKPHGMPSAPLNENKDGTVLGWFLEMHPKAAMVSGKKTVEHGLLHRLDTGTEGLVLIAKTQLAFDKLQTSQQNDQIIKQYFAFCSIPSGTRQPATQLLPFTISSRFRSFGPKGREVRPLFPGMRDYDEAGREYLTTVEKLEAVSPAGNYNLSCVLTRGYRHQVRAHLAWLGYPIIGDSLYHTEYRGQSDIQPLPLQLYATGISFPDPETGKTEAFSLPQPDRTNL